MKLYAFGHKNCPQLQRSSHPSDNPLTTPILQATTIKILWSSWCDTVVAYQDTTPAWTITCTGIGILPTIRDHITGSVAIKEAIGQPEGIIEFFGPRMHDGLRGYLISSSNSISDELVIFSTDLEIARGGAVHRVYVLKGVWRIVAIQMDSCGGILVSLKSKITSDQQTLYFEDLETLRKELDSAFTSYLPTQRVATFTPKQWCNNSTTFMVIDSRGGPHTMSRDPRYPKCLGRGVANTTSFEPVTYLSETVIEKIASGGYMSAAVSLEGELFIWGQANPGCEADLLVLREGECWNGSQGERKRTGISAEDDEDGIVKCLNVFIEGEEACTRCVAIGHGHILVAAEVKKAGCTTKRAVLSAGVNTKGQLGLQLRGGFVEDFKEIPMFRDKKIGQLVATGWTTFVLTLED
jgi:hypothetical protein